MAFLGKAWAPKLRYLQDELNSRHGDDCKRSLTTPTYHPLNDELRLLNSGSRHQPTLGWYTWFYENLLDIYHMQKTIVEIPSTKFERRSEKKKLPALFPFCRLHQTIHEVELHLTEKHTLSILLRARILELDHQIPMKIAAQLEVLSCSANQK